MGVFSFTGQDLKRFAVAAKEIYGEKKVDLGLGQIKDMLKRWDKAQKEAAAKGPTGFANPPAPSKEIADEAVATVNRFLAVLARDHGQAYADDVIRRWRS